MSENSFGVPTILIYIYIYIYDVLFFLFFQHILDILESWPTLAFFWEVLTNFLASPETRNVSAKCGGLGDPQGFKVGFSLEIPTFDVSKKKSIIWWCFSYMFFLSGGKGRRFQPSLGKKNWYTMDRFQNLWWNVQQKLTGTSTFQSLSFQGSCHGWAHVWGTWVTS